VIFINLSLILLIKLWLAAYSTLTLSILYGKSRTADRQTECGQRHSDTV